jgi:hypothetical protein
MSLHSYVVLNIPTKQSNNISRVVYLPKTMFPKQGGNKKGCCNKNHTIHNHYMVHNHHNIGSIRKVLSKDSNRTNNAEALNCIYHLLYNTKFKKKLNLTAYIMRINTIVDTKIQHRFNISQPSLCKYKNHKNHENVQNHKNHNCTFCTLMSPLLLSVRSST